MSSSSAAPTAEASTATAQRPRIAPANALTALIVVPTLDAGAADNGAVELVRILTAAGHRAIVVSRMGSRVAEIKSSGAEFVARDVSSHNPLTTLRNAFALARLVRDRRCGVMHAHGRAAAWSAWLAARMTGVPFITSWYKGFREQNAFKRIYNGVMARGDHVVAVSEQIAQLVNDRYGTPWPRISVIPQSIDLDRFDPAKVSRARIDAIRTAWGVGPETKLILVTGRILRRKGHDVVVRALRRLKDMGLKDFLCVFIGDDRGRTQYTGELWDLVLATDTVDLVRMAGPLSDLPAAFAAADVAVSAAVQPEGLQRAILEAQAMETPVVVSDLAAGPEAVLTPPAVSQDKITGLRFPTDDEVALAATLLRLFSMPVPVRRAIGQRGREWVVGHFNADAVAEPTLQLYESLSRRVVGPK